MLRAYKRHHGYWWMFLLLPFTGVAAGMGLGIAVGDQIGTWAAAILIGCIVAGIVAAGLYTSSKERERLNGIQESLSARGYLCNFAPDPGHLHEFFLGMAYLESWVPLTTGASGIVWYAARQSGDVYNAVFEHRYVRGSGKHVQVHEHTVWASCHTNADGSRVGGDFRLQVFRTRGLNRRSYRSRKEAPWPTGDEDFDRIWLAYADRDPVSPFLHSAVREVLTNSPAGESWHLGDGWMSCVFEGTLDRENFEAFLDRAEHVEQCAN